jgi:hypothetical protein
MTRTTLRPQPPYAIGYAVHPYADVRDAADDWRGVDGYLAGEPLTVVTGPDGEVTALNVASFIYTRTPYDPGAPVPGGVKPDAWHGGGVS